MTSNPQADVSTPVVDPYRYYEIKGQVYPLTSITQSIAVGNNTVILTGVSGVRVLVMGYIFMSTSAAVPGVVSLKDGSGGTTYIIANSPIYGNAAEKIPPGPVMLMTTTAGTGLYCDVAANQSYVTVWYISYTV